MIWMKVTLISLFSIYVIFAEESLASFPDNDLSIAEIAEKYGYSLERHEITTEDGYILTMFRIPHGKGGSGVNPKPLLMVHGFYFQTEHYIIGEAHNASLALMSADNGYDVWLGNCRGTKNGKKHKTLDPKSKAFWDFSFHEMGMHDLPAMIDHILDTTQKVKLHYIGHSQGGSAFYVMCSQKPKYQEKIIMASLMAPASYVSNCTSTFFRTLANHEAMLSFFTALFRLYEYPPGTMMEDFLTTICVDAKSKTVCDEILYVFNGGRSGEMDMEMLPSIIKYLSNAAIKQLLHFFQLIVSGHFRQWDYGLGLLNLKHYGSMTPPEYKVGSIKVPIAIYNSLGDNLVDDKDIRYMCSLLPNCLKITTMENPQWSHIDFLFSTNAGEKLYGPLLEYMNEFN